MKEIYRYVGPDNEHLIFNVIDDNEYYVYQGGAYFPRVEGLKLADALYKDHGKGWISVKDRLPDDRGKQYLVYDMDEGDCAVARYYNDTGNWSFIDDFWAGQWVTHWMPLPEPPED